MPKGRTSVLTVTLTPTDAATLLAWQRSPRLKAGLACRGRMVLLRAQGLPLTEIATKVGVSRQNVDKWLKRFHARGIEGLHDHQRPQGAQHGDPLRPRHEQAVPNGPPMKPDAGGVSRHRANAAPDETVREGGRLGHLPPPGGLPRRGRHSALTVTLTPTDAATLHAWQRSTRVKAGLAYRGRIVLLRAQGETLTAIAAKVGVSRQKVEKWLKRFQRDGLAGLRDKPRRGLPVSHVSRIMADRDRGSTAFGTQKNGTQKGACP
jgi:transposase